MLQKSLLRKKLTVTDGRTYPKYLKTFNKFCEFLIKRYDNVKLTLIN